MLEEIQIFDNILKVFLTKQIINIYGKSGTGKTTLALQIVGNLITKSIESDESCVWIQASETFPKKRLKMLFENSPEKLQYIIEKILITPKMKICNSYQDQQELLNRFYNDYQFIPPNTKYIVIDNISHHLRYEINKIVNLEKISSLIDDFFNIQLFPLIMNCHREGIHLILLHEMTYNPKLDQNLKFLDIIYKRLDALNIFLDNNLITENKIIEITLEDSIWCFNYIIDNYGFLFKG